MWCWKAVISLSNQYIAPGKTIGIIGGGQLGRMMALAAKEAGFRVVVLDPAPASPCGQVADQQIVAPYHDYSALEELAEKADVITYEFENIDYEALKRLSEKAHVPQGAELIRITQDRITEKAAIEEAGIIVAPYKVIDSLESLEQSAHQLGFPCVLKTARGGYDGKGQYVIHTPEEISEASILLNHGSCVLEAWVPCEKEVSVIITRNPSGEMKCFPLGENIHINNILHQTIVPARTEDTVKEKASSIAIALAEHLQLVGTLAVEMFVTKDGSIFVNELAPRPHNSGHYTIEACEISQFAQHIRAICNWPLKSTALLKPAVMVNILGQHTEGLLEWIPRQPEWSIHLYGKDESKTNRKMGHITMLTNDMEKTLEELNEHEIWKTPVR
jgi:5-(carboxyamino)imidazole ribonucleotide synthase